MGEQRFRLFVIAFVNVKPTVPGDIKKKIFCVMIQLWFSSSDFIFSFSSTIQDCVKVWWVKWNGISCEVFFLSNEHLSHKCYCLVSKWLPFHTVGSLILWARHYLMNLRYFSYRALWQKRNFLCCQNLSDLPCRIVFVVFPLIWIELYSDIFKEFLHL